jgi:hypothetical protein
VTISTATLLDAVVAFGTLAAIAIAVFQLRANRIAASEAFARQMWTDYLKLGLENPDLGETRIARRELKLGLEQLVSGDSRDAQRYLWFLTVVLDACENIDAHLQTETWTRTVREQLRFHKEALRQLWRGPNDNWHQFYSARLGTIVDSVLAEP